MEKQVTTLAKARSLRYLNKDFATFKQEFVDNHLKVFFRNTYTDFNESSLGILLVEIMAFVGDNMSFYLDKKFAESFIDTAQETRNIFKHAKQLGFKAFGKSSAYGAVDCFISVPAIVQNGQIIPDMRYAGIVYKGAKLANQTGQTYETLENVDFSTIDINKQADLAVSSVDPQLRQPTSFALRKRDVAIKAGETKSATFVIQAYQQFLTLTLPDTDVLEVMSVTDSQANVWYEVDFLAQDTVFDSVTNTTSDSTDVPYSLKLRPVPYRFVTEYDYATRQTSLTFGTGDASYFDHELIPNLGDLSIPTFGKDTFTDFSIDPQNFLRTRTLGLAPINTTLTVRYRVGGGSSTNAGALQIKTVTESSFSVGDSTLPENTVRDVKNSLSVQNPISVQGGRDDLSPGEIKQLIAANFASQGRAVTAEDYIARSLSMPSKFGSIFRARANVGQLNKNSVELVVLSKDSNGFVTVAPTTLKQNLATYLGRFRMLTDAVEILDGKVINIRVSFNILVHPQFNRTEVLTDCLNRLQNFFQVDKWQIGQPLIRTDLHYLLADVEGVLSVYQIDVTNLVETVDNREYSSTTYNIAKATKNNIIYCDPNSIFAVKYPEKDLIGSAK